MHPDLFSIGPVTLHTYGLFVALGFFVGLMVAKKLGEPAGLSRDQVMDMGFIIILSAIIGSRVMYVLMNTSYYTRNPLDMFKIWQGGLVFSGGVLAVVLTMVWYIKRHGLSLGKIADLWAPAVAIGEAIGRIGCLMAGCCYGRPTGMPWGITFTDPHSLACPLNVPLHPTQIYTSLSGIIIFITIMLLYVKRQFEGQVFLWFLILHSTARLVIEQFRGDDRGVLLSSGMSMTQFVAILILISAAGILIIAKARKKD
ncbi:Prolipoprotein diacylglyceryl transferase [uncultured Desulfobacterium sp.]|uniref:Phosphatidylglycerol--prolipoprotein diacylglyceryl transferase n=1 Tax=uncultured Desulfobacterium sp. TaxID=201089 RepID=A0A445MWF3_9BACT|nr:Prolipoprotein diacylglyceryl transferase [uncultured Desulfobacterium sp.]